MRLHRRCLPGPSTHSLQYIGRFRNTHYRQLVFFHELEGKSLVSAYLVEYRNIISCRLYARHRVPWTKSPTRRPRWHIYARHACGIQIDVIVQLTRGKSSRFVRAAITYWFIDMYVAKSFEMGQIWLVAWRKYLFPASPNFQCSGSWYLTPLANNRHVIIMIETIHNFTRYLHPIRWCPITGRLTFERELDRISCNQRSLAASACILAEFLPA